MNPSSCPASREELKQRMASLHMSLPLSDDPSVLFEPIALGTRVAPNRFVALPMEGQDADAGGAPTERTRQRYARIAAGGAGVIWVEACAVTGSARAHPNSLWLHERNLDRFKDLVQCIRAAAGQDTICLLQLTHAGRYSRPRGLPQPLLVRRNAVLDRAMGISEDDSLLTDAYLDDLKRAFLASAELAVAAGFDGVDVKACHGYLVSELLAAQDRPGSYGGSLENRTRFLLETVTAIRVAHPDRLITCRLGVYDGAAFPSGFGVSRDERGQPDLSEPRQLARKLADAGVGLMGVTMGYPRFDPHYGRPSAKSPPENPLIGVHRLVTATGDMQAAVPELPMVAAGLSWLAGTLPLVAAGIVAGKRAQLIGLGRTSIAYPQMVNDLRRTGAIAPKACCAACAQCSQLMKDGNRSGCAVREPAVYGAELRRGPQKWLGAFLCSQPASIDRVYGNSRRARLESLLPMCPDVVTADDLTAHPERLNSVRYLFSTWGMPALDAGQIDALFPRLEAVFYAAGSVRHFAAPFIEKGIHVISGFRANAVPVAEYTVAHILLAAKGALAMQRGYTEARGRPRETGQPSYPGNYGLTVSLLGAGAIGSLVIELLKPFDMNILVFDPFLDDERAAALNVTKVSLEDAFARGTAVSNHLANLPETQRMIRGEHIASMLPGATFINTGRGATVDEPAMIDVLRNRPDITAVLDVTWPEPPEADSPLWTLPNVFLTPHIAGSMGQEVWRMADYVIEEFLRYTNDKPLRHEVTASMLAIMA